MPASRDHQNIYGRRFGRGLRPWLLIPKIVFVAVFLGGLVSLIVLGFLRRSPATPAEWRDEAELVRLAYARVIVPGLLGALMTGVLLVIIHRGVLLRMRWLQVKLALIVVFVPIFHLFMSSRSVALGEAVKRGDFSLAGPLRDELLRGTVATLAFALAVILLGRLKPRLGQRYGRTFSRHGDSITHPGRN